MESIDKELLYKALINGAVVVMENSLHLNRINVFPVADGDTGTNLYSLMNHIVMNAEIKSSVRETLEDVADLAIVGAKGNSGLIFAQYFSGVSQVNEKNDDISASDFVKATKRGFVNAYDAVENPVEGTILTTMRIFHESLSLGMNKGMSFFELLEDSYNSVEEAVFKTTEQLVVLKKASVVDSGAKGFAFFLKGFIAGLKGEVIDKRTIEYLSIQTTKLAEIPHDETNMSKERYCTEALLEGDEKDRDQLKQVLATYGDSIVIGMAGNKVRLHIHTDCPSALFEYLSSKYLILNQKVEDMKWQYKLLHQRKYNRVLITDSIADVPLSLLDAEQVVIVHLNVLVGRENYIDKLTITNNQLFKRALTLDVHPTSSQPSVKKVEDLYRQLLDHHEEVIVISVSKALSGTYNVMRLAAKAFEDRVKVIDSKQNSVAQGLLVYKSVLGLQRWIGSAQLQDQLKRDIEKSKILVSIQTLDNMVASGRLPSFAGRVGKWIGLKPIITLDDEGKGSIEKVVFNHKKSLIKIVEHLRKVNKEKGIDMYAIAYVDDKHLAKELSGKIESVLGFPCTYIVESSSIIAAGAGKGAIAVAYITY